MVEHGDIFVVGAGVGSATATRMLVRCGRQSDHIDPKFGLSVLRGIGSALVREVTRRAEQLGEPLVVLEGSPTFYGRLGFEHSMPRSIHFSLPSWAPPEAAQVMRLDR